MTIHHLHSVLQCLRTLAGPPELTQLSDRELLLRYARHRDESSFTALVRRHAALVLGVSCRLLTCAQDAEDVFQATFFVLARKAHSLRWRDSVASWLFEVAHRLALKSRTEITRRQRHERQVAKTMRVEYARDGSLQELCTVLDEELRNLPERYRLPLLLCYLVGRTRDQAARQMGWSLRTLHRRLERGLALLRARLTARDLTLSSVLVSAEPAQQTVSAYLSTTLLRDTVQASLRLSLPMNAARLPAVVLAEEGLKSMVLGGAPSLELKRRTEEILQRIDESRIRSERAIEVLAMIGDIPARKYLRELADGLTGAARTNDAAQTLALLSGVRKERTRP